VGVRVMERKPGAVGALIAARSAGESVGACSTKKGVGRSVSVSAEELDGGGIVSNRCLLVGEGDLMSPIWARSGPSRSQCEIGWIT
jgi:hypothetical protein